MRVFLFFFLTLLSFAQVLAQTPTISWYYDLNDSAFGNAAAADLDGDGSLEIVFGCYRNDSMVYALNAENGTLLWKRNLAGFGEGCNDTAPLLYDVDQDGALEVIVPASCNPTTFCFDGATGVTKWATPLYGSDSPPTVSDLDDDGKPEILHGNFGGYVTCLNGEDGSLAWTLTVDPNSWIQTAPIILDADNNGQLDFVVANWSFGANHKIFCFRAHDQSLLWETDLPDDVMYHGASFADLDGDGLQELVIGSYDGYLYALNAEDGSLFWSYIFPTSYYAGAATSIADLNNDGFYEVVYFDLNRLGVLSFGGELLWSFSIPSFGQSFRGAALSDVNGDEVLDVVFGASNGILYALRGDTGEKIWDLDLAEHYGSPDFELDHGPVIADFDQDGLIDIFVVGGHTEYPDFQNNYGRAYVVSANAPGGPDWLMFRRDSVRSAHVPLEMETRVAEVRPPGLELVLSPNPASGIFSVHLEAQESTHARVSLVDMRGKEVQRLHEGALQEGSNVFIRERKTAVPAGIYFCRVLTSAGVVVQKWILTD